MLLGPDTLQAVESNFSYIFYLEGRKLQQQQAIEIDIMYVAKTCYQFLGELYDI